MALNLTVKEMLDHSKHLPQICICCRWHNGYPAIWTGHGDDVSVMFEQMAYVYGAEYVQKLAKEQISSFGGNYCDTLYLILDCAAPDVFSYEYSLEDAWEDVQDQIFDDSEWKTRWSQQIKPCLYGDGEGENT